MLYPFTLHVKYHPEITPSALAGVTPPIVYVWIVAYASFKKIPQEEYAKLPYTDPALFQSGNHVYPKAYPTKTSKTVNVNQDF